MGEAFRFELLSEFFYMLSFGCGMIVLKCFMGYSPRSNLQTVMGDVPMIPMNSPKKPKKNKDIKNKKDMNRKKEELVLLPVPTYDEAFPNINDDSGYLIKDQRLASRSNTLDSTYGGSLVTTTNESQTMIGVETIV